MNTYLLLLLTITYSLHIQAVETLHQITPWTDNQTSLIQNDQNFRNLTKDLKQVNIWDHRAQKYISLTTKSLLQHPLQLQKDKSSPVPNPSWDLIYPVYDEGTATSLHNLLNGHSNLFTHEYIPFENNQSNDFLRNYISIIQDSLLELSLLKRAQAASHAAKKRKKAHCTKNQAWKAYIAFQDLRSTFSDVFPTKGLSSIKKPNVLASPEFLIEDSVSQGSISLTKCINVLQLLERFDNQTSQKSLNNLTQIVTQVPQSAFSNNPNALKTLQACTALQKAFASHTNWTSSIQNLEILFQGELSQKDSN